MELLRFLPLAILLLVQNAASATAEPASGHARTAVVNVADREGSPGATKDGKDAGLVAPPGMIERMLDRMLGSEILRRVRGATSPPSDGPRQDHPRAVGQQPDSRADGSSPSIPEQARVQSRPASPIASDPRSKEHGSRHEGTEPSSKASDGLHPVVVGEGRLITRPEAEGMLSRYGSIPGTRGGLTLVSARGASSAVVVGEGRLITRAEAEAMVKRYGSVPGGFVLEEAALGMEGMKAARYEPSLNAFILDERVVYLSQLPARSAASLARALAEDDRVGISLGEEVQIVYGRLPKSSDLALDLKLADNFLGDIILPPQEWTVGYRFAKGFEPRQDVGRGTAAVFFTFRDFRFAVRDEKLNLSRASFDARIVPIVAKKARDGGYLPDFKAISAGVGYEWYEIGAEHVADNIDYYRKERIVERVLAYGEVAAFFRALKTAGVDLRELASSMRAADAGSIPGRPARTLEEGWLDYLAEIQHGNHHANWSAPPHDFYLSRMKRSLSARQGTPASR